MEEWKDINGFENYQISNTGKIRNIKRNKELTPCISNNGYAVVNLRSSSKTHTTYIHRLIAEHFLDTPNEEQTLWAYNTVYGKVQVNHIDGNKLNNHIDNLEWSTGKENTKHAYDNGLSSPIPPDNKGETNGQSKLTKEQVLEIRRLYEELNYTQTELAKIYNLNSSTISMIVTRKRWKHI